MLIKLNDTHLVLEDIQAALPTRRWVTAVEVGGALGVKGSADHVGQLLGKLGLVRTVVRVGQHVARVWLIRGGPAGDTPQTIKDELLAHGFTPAPKPRVKAKRSVTVKLGTPAQSLQLRSTSFPTPSTELTGWPTLS